MSWITAPRVSDAAIFKACDGVEAETWLMPWMSSKTCKRGDDTILIVNDENFEI